MKRYGYAGRCMALLLALALVVSCLPVRTNAALGDKFDGGTNVTGFDPKDSVYWPVKIYDYLSDGMLFEFGEANATSTSVPYGGGATVPQSYGAGAYNNYTYRYAYAYSDTTFGKWAAQDGRGSSSRVESTNFRSPVYRRVLRNGEASGGRHSAVMMDFYENNANYKPDGNYPATYVSGYPSRDSLRYAVLVYRTGGGYQEHIMRFDWSVSKTRSYTTDSAKTTSVLNGNDFDILWGEEVACKPSEEWTYMVYDMNSGTADQAIAKRWDSITNVAGVRCVFPMDANGEYMDVSYFACFDTEDEARTFGKAAATFSNDPGQDLTKAGYFSDAGYPEVALGVDFTRDYAATNNTIGQMDDSLTVQKTANVNNVNSRFITVSAGAQTRITDFVTNLGGARAKDHARYMVMAYRINSGVGSGSTVGFTWNGTNTAGSIYDYGTGNVALTGTAGQWAYQVFDMKSGNVDANWDSLSTIRQLTMRFNDFSSGWSVDISQIAYFADEADADAFGRRAASFAQDPGVFRNDWSGWNMGNNRAFGLLRGSNGGGWGSGNTGDNSMANGYDSYDIGYNFIAPVMSMRQVDGSKPSAACSYHDFSKGADSNGRYICAVCGGSATSICEYKHSFVKATDFDGDACYRCSKCCGVLVSNYADSHIYQVSCYDAGASYVEVGQGKGSYTKNTATNTYTNVGYGNGNYNYVFNTIDTSQLDLGGYKLHTLYSQGLATMGLVESRLREDANGNKYLSYTETTVDYLATLLAETLTIPRVSPEGFYNYNYVEGQASVEYGEDTDGDGIVDTEKDLATVLRECLGITFRGGKAYIGDYCMTDTYDDGSRKVRLTAEMYGSFAGSEAKRESLIGSWSTVKGSIKTFNDAAYYLLENLFVADSYNKLQNDFAYLQLSKADTANVEDVYVFDGGFSTGNSSDPESSVHYDIEDGIIKNSNADQKTMYYYDGNDYTTYFPFLPIQNDGNDGDAFLDLDGNVINQTWSPYFMDSAVTNNEAHNSTYEDRNFNYVMQTNGEFVYHSDDDLYFEFEGDDDVYLFINDQLVLDIGGAHAITTVSMKVNDYVEEAKAVLAEHSSCQTGGCVHSDAELTRAEALALEDGQIADFDFYYMERHGYGANCRIVTNIRVTDPGMQTVKTAYQDGEQIEYGGIVLEDRPIEYRFAIQNTGNTKLYNMVLADDDIGVTLSYANGLQIADPDRVCDSAGGSLDVTDLKAFVTPANVEVTFADQQALKQFLEKLYAPDFGLESGEEDAQVTGSGAGLWVGASVSFSGIYYEMTDTQKNEGMFNNTVRTTATDKLVEGQTLRSEARHRLYLAPDPLYYQWAGHTLYVDMTQFLSDCDQASSDLSNPLYEQLGTVQQLVSKGAASMDMVICNKNGEAEDVPGVTVVHASDASERMEITFDDSGAKSFYVKLQYTSDPSLCVVVHVIVYVADVEESTYVLDYGLTTKDLGYGGALFKNDQLLGDQINAQAKLMGVSTDLPFYLGEYDEYEAYKKAMGDEARDEVKYQAGAKLNQIEFTQAKLTDDLKIEFSDGDHTFRKAISRDPIEFDPQTGSYTMPDQGLSFTPTDFMDEEYKLWLAITVHETWSDEGGAFIPTALGDKIDITKETQLYKEVKVLPATVVYYEDDFDGIDYTSSAQGSFEMVEGSTGSGELLQSIDKEENYGSDAVYDSGSAMSGDSIHKIKISSIGEVASFTFTGTGFEIISRTNAYDSASFYVDLYQLSTVDGEPTETLQQRVPVITEFDNHTMTADGQIQTGAGGTEEIYQVPVIRLDDLELGSYMVKIFGIPEYEDIPQDDAPDTDTTGLQTKDTYLYLDGIRIFQPLGDSHDDYNVREDGAQILEIRDEIVTGDIAVVDHQSGQITISTATHTWTENRNGKDHDGTYWEGNQVDSVEDYLVMGPNNEVYQNGEPTISALAFYVMPKEGASVMDLQIGVRAIDQRLFNGSGVDTARTELWYSTGEEDGWNRLAAIGSSTEQYYTIPLDRCPRYDDGRYLVLIKVENGMASFSSLKYNGLTIIPCGGPSTDLVYQNGVLVDKDTGGLVDGAMLADFDEIAHMMRSSASVHLDQKLPAPGGEAEAVQGMTAQVSVSKSWTPSSKIDSTVLIGLLVVAVILGYYWLRRYLEERQ